MSDTECPMKQIHQNVLFYMKLCHERSPTHCVTNIFPLNGNLDQVQQVIQYLESSLICRGIQLKDNESIIAMNPHLTSQFTDLSEPILKTETRVFSMKCQVISTGTDSQCKNCKA